MITCLDCRAEDTVAAWLVTAHAWWAALRLVRLRCPTCAAVFDARPEPDVIWLGYVYAAGSPHFSPEIEVPAPGLRLERGDAVALVLGDLVVQVPSV